MIGDIQTVTRSKMKKDPQFYSKIALECLNKYQDEFCPTSTVRESITWGNPNLMEELYDAFGGDRDYLAKHPMGVSAWINYKYSFVMNKLDRESKRPNAIFKKGYITYSGTSMGRCRCFYLED